MSGILNLLGGGEGARNGVRFLFSDTESALSFSVVLGTSCVWEGVNWSRYPMTHWFPLVALEALFLWSWRGC